MGTRALQTYSHMRQGTTFDTNVTVEPRISELASDGSSENMGRSVKELMNDWQVMILEGPMNEINFSTIEGEKEWWNSAQAKEQQQERMQAWLHEISLMKKGPVVVVTHFNVIRRLTDVKKPENAV